MSTSLAQPSRLPLRVLTENKAINTSISTPDKKNPTKSQEKVISTRSQQGVQSSSAGCDGHGRLAFDKICQDRVPEDPGAELEAQGVQKWSTDDFEFVRQLGSGGLATVFEARERSSGYRVALKVQADTDDAFNEMSLHDGIKNRGIVEMFDYFTSTDPGQFVPITRQTREGASYSSASHGNEDTSHSEKSYLFMILECCDGGCLYDLITDECSLDEERARVLFRSALEAIRHLHEYQALIHCDIKSMNFLLDDTKSTLKLCDFGMAVPVDEPDILGGSPVYMAPEHLMAWRHCTEDFDERVDTYSLGILLYEMLMGYLPYEVLQENDNCGDKDGTDDDELESLMDRLDKVAIDNNQSDDDFFPPVLDLRKLDDVTAEEPVYVPPPIFPDHLSEEAQDLIMRLMEHSADDRISLDDALQHQWITFRDSIS